MKWLKLETNERKNLSLWMMFGGGLVFTVYAIAGLWMVHTVPLYIFWLAVIAHIQIFSIMAGFIAQLVKRRITAGKQGISITDDSANFAEKENVVSTEPEVPGSP